MLGCCGAEIGCHQTRAQVDQRLPMAALLLESRQPSTSANFARYLSSVLRHCWSSTKMAGCSSTTHDCAKFWDTARKSSIFVTAVCIGMILISARGSSANYESKAARF